MTSLIDVIFLLLLFFMLTSTFSRFSEVKLSQGGAGAASGDTAELVLVRISGEGASLNGEAMAVDEMPARIGVLRGQGEAHLVVSVVDGATSQALVGVLHRLRGVERARMTVVR